LLQAMQQQFQRKIATAVSDHLLQLLDGNGVANIRQLVAFEELPGLRRSSGRSGIRKSSGFLAMIKGAGRTR
jgi:hypothetical protein